MDEAQQGSVRPCVLVVIAADIYVRNTVRAGSFDRLEGFDVLWVASDRFVQDLDPLVARTGWLGTVSDQEHRVAQYGRLEVLMRAARRFRSRTLSVKTNALPPRTRRAAKLLSLPGVRLLTRRWLLSRTGEHPEIAEILRRERPDLVIAPTGGNDALVNDALRCARSLCIKSLALVHNWDGLTSKGSLPVLPDHVAVWGHQSASQATSVVGIPRERVHILGAPSLDHYFGYLPRSRPSPFPFSYALFAGCYAPFDEREPVEALDRAIEQADLDLTLVYRPHPDRARRARPDVVDERRLDHVVLDPTIRDAYTRSFAGESKKLRRAVAYPPLDSYPPLLEHAALVVCPLSTMLIESAIMGRKVLAIAYGDGVHRVSPATTVGFDHFDRLEQLPGLELVKSPAELRVAFVRAVHEPPLPRPDPVALHYWIYSDPRTYSERLRELVSQHVGSPEIARSAAETRAI